MTAKFFKIYSFCFSKVFGFLDAFYQLTKAGLRKDDVLRLSVTSIVTTFRRIYVKVGIGILTQGQRKEGHERISSRIL